MVMMRKRCVLSAFLKHGNEEMQRMPKGRGFQSTGAATSKRILQVNCQTVMLDLAPNAFDDQYMDCADKMYEKVKSTGLLQKELSQNSAFSQQWSRAKTAWAIKKKDISLPKGFRDEYGIAIVAYTGDDIYQQFNNAVIAGGRSYEYYMNNFHFKSLHFYLTMGLQLLRKNCRTDGQTVYRGIDYIQYVPPSGSKTIRFGKFTSTSLSHQEAETFGTHSFFTMKTCFGVTIAPFSLFPEEEEVLIPLNEEFTVIKYTELGHQFVLNGTSFTCSDYDCAYLKGTFGSGFQASRIARSANEDVKMKSGYCIYNSAPGGAGVMTSLVFSGILTILNTALLKI